MTKMILLLLLLNVKNKENKNGARVGEIKNYTERN